jgi:hypothetical protein
MDEPRLAKTICIIKKGTFDVTPQELWLGWILTIFVSGRLVGGIC